VGKLHPSPLTDVASHLDDLVRLGPDPSAAEVRTALQRIVPEMAAPDAPLRMAPTAGVRAVSDAAPAVPEGVLAAAPAR
jgi:hypothetical protein